MKKIIQKFLLSSSALMVGLALAASFHAMPVSADSVDTGDPGGAPAAVDTGTTGGAPGAVDTGVPKNPPAAVDTGNGGVFYLQNPLDSKFNTIGGILSGFLDIFTYLVIVMAILMIIYVGLRLVLASGNPTEIQERKTQLLYLLVGVGVVIGARVLISVVINTLQATGLVNPSVINNAQNAIK